MSDEPPCLRDSKYRFLYLGSDLELIAAVRKVLPETDYQLVACGDQGGAKLFLQSDIRYHALVIDFEWRGKEGLELAQLAHSLKHRKRMPIMVVAAAKLPSEMETVARKAGVKTFATKSPDMRAVTDAIRQLLKR